MQTQIIKKMNQSIQNIAYQVGLQHKSEKTCDAEKEKIQMIKSMIKKLQQLNY